MSSNIRHSMQLLDKFDLTKKSSMTQHQQKFDLLIKFFIHKVKKRKHISRSSSMSQKMNHFYRILVEDSKRRESLSQTLNHRQAKEVETVYNKSRLGATEPS